MATLVSPKTLDVSFTISVRIRSSVTGFVSRLLILWIEDRSLSFLSASTMYRSILSCATRLTVM